MVAHDPSILSLSMLKQGAMCDLIGSLVTLKQAEPHKQHLFF